MKDTYISGLYYIRCSKDYSFENAVEIVCCEESIGIESITFTDTLRIYPGITTASEHVKSEHKSTYEVIDKISKSEGIVRIFFPAKNILQKGAVINSIFSTLMGDLFGIDVVEDIKLLDVEFCKDVINCFSGPKYGIDGIANYLNSDFPLVGVITKPNIGLTPKETGDLVYSLCMQGADFIKDDELMVSTDNCPLDERVKYVRDAMEKARATTGKKALYAINISADADMTYENACIAIENGANSLMLNVFTTGFDVLHKLASDKNINVPIHTHRCMHDVFTSRKSYGVSSVVFAKLVRLCGADFYHIGIFANKSEEKTQEMLEVYDCLTNLNIYEKKAALPIVSRSSLLSIDVTNKYIQSPNLLFLMCGSYYRSKHKEIIISAMKDKIKNVYYNQKISEEYSDCYSEVDKMYSDCKKEVVAHGIN